MLDEARRFLLAPRELPPERQDGRSSERDTIALARKIWANSRPIAGTLLRPICARAKSLPISAVVGEGIETVLSLKRALPELPKVAALSAARLAAWEFPSGFAAPLCCLQQ
jgi:hypothetical protein